MSVEDAEIRVAYINGRNLIEVEKNPALILVMMKNNFPKIQCLLKIHR